MLNELCDAPVLCAIFGQIRLYLILDEFTRQITKEFNLPNWPQIKRNYLKSSFTETKMVPASLIFAVNLYSSAVLLFCVYSKVFPALPLLQKSRRSDLWPKWTVAGWTPRRHGLKLPYSIIILKQIKECAIKNWRCQMSCGVSDTAAVTLPPTAVGQLEWCNYPVVAIATYSWSS